MPRKQRIEYPGALYHIISRGNYRKALFADRKTAKSFESTILEAAQRCGWIVYAYVIMNNHYHLAIQTPKPNMVTGMKWLQSTFATRFNRFHKEHGHVFQGRYKPLLIKENRSLLGLINYINLNPVRANICKLKDLQTYELSSFPKYLAAEVAPPLDRKAVLSLCGLPDSPEGMLQYQKDLGQSEENDPNQQTEISKKYCRGWFIGSEEAKHELSRELTEKHPNVIWEGSDLKQLNELEWEAIVQSEMSNRNIGEEEIQSSAKGADWKVQIAKRLRKETTAGNPWIAKRLNMGHPNYVSNLVNKVNRNP